MRFGEKSVTDQLAYSICGTNLLFVDFYKDPGIMIDSRFKLHAQVESAVGKAGAIINNTRRSKVCRSVKFMLTLYVSHIHLIIEYRIWNI